jgi:hypothetical protein
MVWELLGLFIGVVLSILGLVELWANLCGLRLGLELRLAGGARPSI